MASFQIVVICAFVNIVLLSAFVNSHVEENSIQNDDTNKNAGASGLPETPTSTVGSTPNSVLCNIYIYSLNLYLYIIKVKYLLCMITTFEFSFFSVERLFQLKRSEQKDALKRITNIQNHEKQKKLLTLVITKIMEVSNFNF